MRLHERYVTLLSLILPLTAVILAVYGESRLDLYVSMFALEYLILTALHSPLDPKTSRMLNAIGAVLFAVFVVIVASKVVEILYGVKLI